LKLILSGISLSIFSFLLYELKLKPKHYFALGLFFCFLSSLIYINKNLFFMNLSSLILATIIALAVTSAYSMVLRKKYLITIPAFIIGFLYPTGRENYLTYSVIYPLLSKIRYTGFLYTTFGLLGIFVQIFLESILISVILNIFS